LKRICHDYLAYLPRVYCGTAANLPQPIRVITAKSVIISRFSSFQAN
jgi:hypothetical protein